MSVKMHDALKKWLIERAGKVTDRRGNQYYTRVFSGDTQPLYVTSGKHAFKYQPDVVLDKNGRLFIIEIAQWDDWRAWVGEMAIAKAHHPSNAIYFIFFDRSGTDVNNIARVMGQALDLKDWWYLILEGKEATDFELAQKCIEEHLKEIGWF